MDIRHDCKLYERKKTMALLLLLMDCRKHFIEHAFVARSDRTSDTFLQASDSNHYSCLSPTLIDSNHNIAVGFIVNNSEIIFVYAYLGISMHCRARMVQYRYFHANACQKRFSRTIPVEF
jgi:hypothetical protein